MAKGMAYDSDEGRNYAASITALMTGEAYKRSAELAAIKGPFVGFEINREPMLDIIAKHHHNIPEQKNFDNRIWWGAINSWTEATGLGVKYGYRNAQTTLLAPTGTISIMMDCDTTGCEPDSSLVRYKKLAGGGTIKHVNGVVTRALKNLLDVSERQDFRVENAKGWYEEYGTFAGYLGEDILPIFDCAFPDSRGRSISWEGHVKMVAAIQPFLSGGISKTINMPQESTVEDIEKAYRMAWELGCKTIAIYRDGSKQTQVLTTTDTEKKEPMSIPSILSNGVVGLPIEEWKEGISIPPSQPVRRRLPDERPSITKKFSVAGVEGYFTVGLYDDGSPGELWVVMAKEGSTLSGFADAFATMVSIALQYGIPLDVMANKFRYSRFEPSGFTNDKNIPLATSIVDYIFNWLQNKFGNKISTPYEVNIGPTLEEAKNKFDNSVYLASLAIDVRDICPECGSLLVQNGTCHMCGVCGFQSGCGA